MSLSLEPLDGSSRNFVCRSPVAVARSSSGGVALRYVLPVLWMTSRLAVMGVATDVYEWLLLLLLLQFRSHLFVLLTKLDGVFD